MMQRKLPIVVIEGVEFYVDGEREELWQVNDPANRISFSGFHPQKEGYTILYNKVRCCLASSKEEVNRHLNYYAWVTLPALTELDPIGIALRYGIPLAMLLPEEKGHVHQRLVAALSPVSRFQ